VTSDSRHDLLIATNLLNRQFAMEASDKVWVGNAPPSQRMKAEFFWRWRTWFLSTPLFRYLRNQLPR
jgi:hypothetical protein